jgi:hypothetical protein
LLFFLFIESGCYIDSEYQEKKKKTIRSCKDVRF